MRERRSRSDDREPTRMSNGYDYDRTTATELLSRLQFPEFAPRESALIGDFLTVHVSEYDRWSMSVRVGEGTPPNPDHLEGIQRAAAFSSRKRIDLIGWQGDQATLFEVKGRIVHHVLGQLITYRTLWLKENPDAREPRLAAIGRVIDPDVAPILADHGITVYLYPAEDGAGGSDERGV
jgi:hypothetical protein